MGGMGSTHMKPAPSLALPRIPRLECRNSRPQWAQAPWGCGRGKRGSPCPPCGAGTQTSSADRRHCCTSPWGAACHWWRPGFPQHSRWRPGPRASTVPGSARQRGRCAVRGSGWRGILSHSTAVERRRHVSKPRTAMRLGRGEGSPHGRSDQRDWLCYRKKADPPWSGCYFSILHS